MVDIGKLNKLKVLKEVDFGVYLNGGDHGEILLPKRYVPKDLKTDDTIEVFIYCDSDDRIIATTEKPLAFVDDFAYLEVISVNKVGAFLSWGLSKDLFVPYGEQRFRMKVGESYVVFVYVDKSERICASSNLDKFLDKEPKKFKCGQEVEIIVCNKTDIGYNAIVDKSAWGLLYKDEIFGDIKEGQIISGFIKKLREDEKIDLCIHKPGFRKVESLSDTIILRLKENNGFLELTDKSPPELIYKTFSVSKKTFKKAIGTLYKKKLINIADNGIKLIIQNGGKNEKNFY